MRFRTILIVIAVVGCVALAGFAYIAYQQEQENTLAKFGAQAVALCDKIDPDLEADGNPEDVGAKLAIIDASSRITVDAMVDALPVDQRAQNQDELTGMVCISTDVTIYDTDTYGEGEAESYTCTRYQSNTTVYVFDVKSGELVSKRSFDGDTPPECPDSTNENLSKYGNPPEPQLIVDWLRQRR